MRTGPRGRALIKHFEGVVPFAYSDPAGHCTFGVGHLIHRGACSMVDRKRWGTRERPASQEVVDRVLMGDLRPREEAVERLVKVRISQHEFDALVSLLFNVGEGNFATSTVLRELNKGHRYRAGLAFLLWNRAGGRVLLGLSRRRRAERRLFRKGRWE
jgi:lysozyme